MSTRRHQQGGWVDIKLLPRGPNGRCLCRRCSTEVPKGKITFCSKECVDQWQIRTSAWFARQKVWERDKGVCAVCSVDTCAVTGRTNRARGTGDLWQADHILPVVEGGGESGLDNLRTLCTKCHREATAALRKRLSKPKR